MSIANKIKYLRESKDMTQVQFGKIAGVSDKAVSTWENGSAEPRMGAIQKIADYFGVSKGWLIDDNSPSSSAPDQELNENERQLVDMYRGMNREGQLKVLDYAADLYESPRYKKEAFISEGMEKIG